MIQYPHIHSGYILKDREGGIFLPRIDGKYLNNFLKLRGIERKQVKSYDRHSLQNLIKRGIGRRQYEKIVSEFPDFAQYRFREF